VLLDDFDRALHPMAQRQLVTCVKDMLEQRADLQFVCTTHSPYVLDLFDAEDVRVLRADQRGLTQARRLTEHPEWKDWKETLKAGEFWSYVGEDWLDASTDGE
jgi:predicted ATP-binding protein involved in virulence